jgi:hypothetical protein
MIKIRERMEKNLATASKLLVCELVLGVTLYVIAAENHLSQLWHLVPTLSLNAFTAWFTVKAAKAKNMRYPQVFWVAAVWPAIAIFCISILLSLDVFGRLKRAIDSNEA